MRKLSLPVRALPTLHVATDKGCSGDLQRFDLQLMAEPGLVRATLFL